MILTRRSAPDRFQRTVDRVEAREERRQAEVEPPTPTSTDPLEVGGPIPPSIGRVADLYHDVHQLALDMQKEVDRIKARARELENYIIDNLSKSDDTGAAGLRYRAQIVMKEKASAKDWPSIYAYIREHDRFDLMNKALGQKAVIDMWKAGEVIPGVEVVKVPDVSITKIGR